MRTQEDALAAFGRRDPNSRRDVSFRVSGAAGVGPRAYGVRRAESTLNRWNAGKGRYHVVSGNECRGRGVGMNYAP